MDSELSFTTILIWALIIQVLILGLVGLVLLHRRFRHASTSHTHVGAPSARRSGRKWLMAGGLMGAVLVAALVYHFILPEEQPWYELYHSRTKAPVQRSLTPQKDNKNILDDSSLPKRSHRDLRSGKGEGAPRIRDATRKFLRGRPPAERKGFRPPDPVLHTYLSLINKWQMDTRNHPEGQVLTAEAVYDRLVKKYGFKGSQSDVRNFFTDQPYSIPEGCGQTAEVSWTSIPVVLNKKEIPLECFFMESTWSGRIFVYCYRCDYLESFLDAHMRSFDFFGGIFPTVVYRNLDDEKIQNFRSADSPQKQIFERFCSFYNFTPEFRNLDEDRDPAVVEGLRAFLTKHLPSGSGFRDLDELNKTLLDRLTAHGTRKMDDRTKAFNKLFEQEKICLLSFPDERFGNITLVEKTVGPSSTLVVGEKRYHLPKAYAGRHVQVTLSYNRIDVFCDSKKIASYNRPCEAAN